MIGFDGALYMLGDGVYLHLGEEDRGFPLFHRAKILRGVVMRFLANTLKPSQIGEPWTDIPNVSRGFRSPVLQCPTLGDRFLFECKKLRMSLL